MGEIKPIKEILEIVKREFNEGIYLCYDKSYRGMCDVVDELVCNDVLTNKESIKFEKYLSDNTTEITRGYPFIDSEELYKRDGCSLYSVDEFGIWLWKPYDKTPRNKWLDKHIELLTNK